MEPFKNIYNKNSILQLGNELARNANGQFDSKNFANKVIPKLIRLEMKDRVRLISKVLYEELPKDFSVTTKILIASLADEDQENGVTGFMTWPLLQYIEDYGLDDFDTSFRAMYEMTKRFSAEFAIRPFLLKDEHEVFKVLQVWKDDPNKHIRRLCSEGIRPNLPWGLKLPNINKDLPRNIKILDHLKDDPEEYVRRSVANHLNDISHLNESLMLLTAKKWAKDRPTNNRHWVIRHATRTLLKKGHPQALALHGYNNKVRIKVSNLKLDKKRIKEGEFLKLDVCVENCHKKDQKVLIDYIVHYLKKDGSLSKRPFRLKDTIVKGREQLTIQKNISFKKVTTRQHYSGKHKISIQVNGNESNAIDFHLKI